MSEEEREGDVCCKCGTPLPSTPSTQPFHHEIIAEQVLTDEGVVWYTYCVPCYISTTNKRKR